jgi:Tfp pilus assembly protein PilX
MANASILKNEKGALMIMISVMLLVLLTIISIAASRTANTELKIAGNEYLYQRCFYNAEGAIMETVELLSTTVDPKEGFPDWVASDEAAINDITVFANWNDGGETSDVIPKVAVIDSEGTSYMAVHHGVLAGSSLAMSKPSIHTFSIYGRCENKGRVILKVGYKGAY